MRALSRRRAGATRRQSLAQRRVAHNRAPMAFPSAPALRRANGARRAAMAVMLALALLLAGLGTPADAQQRLDVREALSAVGDTVRFPDDAPAQLVALPDEWSRSRPDTRGPVWYRVAFDARGAEASGELFALYVARACSTIEVQLNGHRVHVGGRLVEPVTRRCNHPQLIALPAALMRAGINTVDVKVVGEPLASVASRQRAGGLSAMQLGLHAELAPAHARQHLLHVTLPLTASAMLLLVGVFMLLIGGLKRAHSHLVYFGAFAIGWAVVGARLWWTDLPLSAHAADMMLVSFIPFVVLAGVLFVLRYAGDEKRRWIDTALYAQCVVVPPTLLLAGPERLYAVASGWYALFVVEAAAAVGWHLWTLWHRRRERFAPMAALLLGALMLVGLEFVAQQQPLAARWQALSHALLPAAIVAMGLYLMREHGRALQAAEADRQTLESRVREAVAQIERNYAQLAELRVEQVTQQERKRIAADLHDDLGAKLLTIVHTSDNDRISALAREALEEMRLSVRGLTGKPVRLLDALGDWRAEVVSRLAQTGIEADWSTAVEDGDHTLSARVYVQTTRILREAVNNIIKHSGASHCAVRVALDGGQFELSIQDNGNGIPLELDGRLDRGHGMASMKHRAKQMHGQCLVESGPGYGTVIRLTLPLEPATAAA
jgi:signal transduction histidine kinase